MIFDPTSFKAIADRVRKAKETLQLTPSEEKTLLDQLRYDREAEQPLTVRQEVWLWVVVVGFVVLLLIGTTS
jgi:hypothetical protein